MMYLGIDPGVSGGIAAISEARGVVAIRMPKTTEAVIERIGAIAKGKEEVLAIVEKVWAFPPRTKRVGCPKCGASVYVKQPRDGSRQITTFMKNAGMVEGILAALGIQVIYISPQKWQRAIGVYALTKAVADTVSKKKNIHKKLAQDLFPGIKITLATCDALLLAEYGRRLRFHR